MKKLFLTLSLILTISLTFAQNKKKIEEKYNIAVISAFGTYIDFGHKNYKDDGFNIGVSGDFHWNNWFYVGAEIFHFPDLNTFDYTHFIGRFGLNKYLYFGTLEPVVKLNVGYRGGFILRETVAGIPKSLGWEVGITYFIPNTNFYGIVYYGNDIKEDNKDLNGEDSHEVKSVFGGIGYKF